MNTINPDITAQLPKLSVDGDRRYKVGIIGAGFIARGLMMVLEQIPNLTVGGVLTRRDPATLGDLPVSLEIVTHDVERLIVDSDIVVECTGDVIHGTAMIEQVLAAGLPVVTMNSELQLISGTMLARQGVLVEAEGDQPGSLAALDADVRAMGFVPLVYGNVKRFLNLKPTRAEMEYWAQRQGISLTQVTSFTDGTKVQIEQALVANGLGATIACRNLSGITCTALEDGAHRLAEIAEGIGAPISDYILSPTAPAGVFIVATHSEQQAPYLEYLKLGAGPHYVITRPYHLCHLEIPKTLLHILSGATAYSFNNGQRPTVQVYAIPKRDIRAGDYIERGLGSFTIRGEAAQIKDHRQGVPVGLLQEATFVRPVEAGQVVTFDDVMLPETRALYLWRQTVDEVVGTSRARHAQGSDKVAGRRQGGPTVTVGIPAYNEEANIVQVLTSIVHQQARSFSLEKVIVLCDGCTDETETLARDFARHYPVVDVVNSNQRLGKAARLNKLLNVNTSEVVINFDADVVLADRTVIEKMVDKFDEDDVAVVAANFQPVPVRGLVARAIRAGDLLWYQVRRDFQLGHNIHNISGSATALRADFAESFRYPSGLVADQHYTYLHARSQDRKFHFAADAVVWYQTPTLLRDYLILANRSLHEREYVLPYFDDSLRREFNLPLWNKFRGVARSLIAAPVSTTLALGLQILIRTWPRNNEAMFQTGIWETVLSSKKINV